MLINATVDYLPKMLIGNTYAITVSFGSKAEVQSFKWKISNTNIPLDLFGESEGFTMLPVKGATGSAALITKFYLNTKRDATYLDSKAFKIDFFEGKHTWEQINSGNIKPLLTTGYIILEPIILNLKITTTYTTYYEGQTIIFNMSSTNIPDNSEFQYELVGDVDENDFVDKKLKGTVTFIKGAAKLIKIVTDDDIAESKKTFVLRVFTVTTTEGDEIFNTVKVIGKSQNINILDLKKTISIKKAIGISAVVAEDKNTITEGETVYFDISTTNLKDRSSLLFRIVGNNSTNDFTYPTITGNISISKNKGKISFKINDDNIPEIGENLKLQIFRLGVTLNAVNAASLTSTPIEPWIESELIDIVDIQKTIKVTTKIGSSIPLSIESKIVYEGQSIFYIIETTNVPNKTNLSYKLAGSAEINDVSLKNPVGSILIDKNKGFLTVNIPDDAIIESPEDVKILIYNPGVRLNEVDDNVPWIETDPVTILDVKRTIEIVNKVGPDSKSATVRSSAYEGEIIYFEIVTNGVKDKTVLPFKILGIDQSDVRSRGYKSINSTIVNKNKCYIGIPLNEVMNTLPKEVKLQVFNIGTPMSLIDSSTPWIESDTITINKAERSAIIKTKVSTSTSIANAIEGTIVNEGSAVFFEIETLGIKDRTRLHYKIIGDIDQNDFYINREMFGEIEIKKNKGIVSKILSDDGVTELPEKFKLQLFEYGTLQSEVSTATPWVESNEVIVNDVVRTVTIVSKSGPNIKEAIETTTVSENALLFFEIETTNMPRNTTLTYKIVGNVTRADFVGPSFNDSMIGLVNINNNKGVVVLRVSDDIEIDPGETFKLQLFGKGVTPVTINNHSPWMESQEITISEIPRTIMINSKVGTIKSAAIESNVALSKQTIYYDIITTNIPDGTKLSYRLVGNFDSSNYKGSILGSFYINKNIGTVSVYISSGGTPEENKNIKLEVFRKGVPASSSYLSQNYNTAYWSESSEIVLKKE